MKRLMAFLLVLKCVFTGMTYAQQLDNEVTPKEGQSKTKNVIGYYAAWQMYDRYGLCKPANILYHKYTILNYAFFKADSLGNLLGTDYWADSVLLRGEVDWSKSTDNNYFYHPNTSLIDLAHVNGVKVMVSIGGWNDSWHMPAIAADPKKRAHFADECVRIIKDYQFDGIDIDWEFPGYAEHNGTPADKDNFTLLIQGIRTSLDSLGKKMNYDFLLSGAFAPAKERMVDIDWSKIASLMDMINLMSYDYGGPWSEESNHNCPLYSPKKGSPLCVDMSFKLLVDTFHVPSEKINIGINFNGHSLLMTDGKLHGKNTSGKKDMVTWAIDEGSPVYYNILAGIQNFDMYWDYTAKVPYLLSKSDSKIQSFVSYDDPMSMTMKADYVMRNKAAGVLIWEVSGDYVETKPGSGRIDRTPLVDAINKVFPARPQMKSIKKRWPE